MCSLGNTGSLNNIFNMYELQYGKYKQSLIPIMGGMKMQVRSEETQWNREGGRFCYTHAFHSLMAIITWQLKIWNFRHFLALSVAYYVWARAGGTSLVEQQRCCHCFSWCKCWTIILSYWTPLRINLYLRFIFLRRKNRGAFLNSFFSSDSC